MALSCLGRARRRSSDPDSSTNSDTDTRLARLSRYLCLASASPEPDPTPPLTSFFYDEDISSDVSSDVSLNTPSGTLQTSPPPSPAARRVVEWSAVHGDLSDMHPHDWLAVGSAGRDIFGSLVTKDGTRIPRANADYQYRRTMPVRVESEDVLSAKVGGGRAKSTTAVDVLLLGRQQRQVVLGMSGGSPGRTSVSTSTSTNSSGSGSGSLYSSASSSVGASSEYVALQMKPMVVGTTISRELQESKGGSPLRTRSFVAETQREPRSFVSQAQRERMGVYEGSWSR
ncbi:hypothetical protein BZA70DRAFT_287807 [Myxozyma melibiosi]|uniref:Uncharacterized protein n=1 Tax=Myxozyma melibiosi TaxID=54550 RepID=A0ABR1FF71_9ASCO